MRYNISGDIYNEVAGHHAALVTLISDFHSLATEAYLIVDFLGKLKDYDYDIGKSFFPELKRLRAMKEVLISLKYFGKETTAIGAKVASNSTILEDILFRFRVLTHMNPWLKEKPFEPQTVSILNYIKTSDEISIDRGLTFMLTLESDIKNACESVREVNSRYESLIKFMPIKNQDDFELFTQKPMNITITIDGINITTFSA